MIRKLLLSALAVCMTSLMPALADEPFRLHRYDSFQATPVTAQSVVFVGNSITNMQPWAELFTAPNVVNRGNSGDFSWEILANVQSYITRRPAKLFLMIGTNDMNVSGYSPEAVVRNVRQTVKHIQKESPATQVYIQSVMPSTNGSRTVAKGQELNRQLQAMASEMGVTYVDYFDVLMGCTNSTMSYDNLHPHVVGTYAWTNSVASYVGDGVAAVLPANPVVNNGGQQNSYGARASVFGQLPVTGDDVLFIGDEFVHSGEWQELLGNPHVKNRGTGWGKWGPDINYQTSCVPFILQGLAGNVQPKQVLLMIGTQNLTSTSSDKEAFKTKYGACIAAIREKAPDTKITLVSEIPYNVTSLNVSNLVPMNQWLKEKATANENMDYCDLYSLLVNENNEAIHKYLNTDQYVTGLGYQACARELAKHIDGCTVMSEAEAEAYYNLVGARRVLSNAIDAVELGDATVDVEPYYSLLAQDDATIAQLTAAAEALEKALKPQPGHWYTLTAKRNTSVFFTKATSGTGFIASTTIDEGGNSYWQLLEREDGTYDICNGTGYYAKPTATHNVQLTLSQTRPDAGWSLETCDASGAFNITAKVGGSTVNCCMNLTGSNTIFNWITGRTSDQGCQIVFAEVEFDPSTVEQPDTYNVPFQRATVTEGEFSGAQWWYNMKLKDQFYIYDSDTDGYMALDRMQKAGDVDEQWAFVGSDQKGYTIYNHKYGTSKVLAAPVSIGSDNGKTYVTLVDAANVPDGYETRWQFAASTDIAGAYYMYQFEQPTHAVNNYGGNGKLSFWLGGKDAGSAVLFEVAEAILPVNKETGAIYRNGAEVASGWASQWKSFVTEPFQITFGTSYNNMNASTMGIAVGSASGAWTFTLSNQEYYVKSYSFEIKAGNNNQVVTPADGVAVSINTSTFSTITWENDAKGQKQASFTYSGANAESTIRDMVVTIRPSVIEREPQVNVFEYGSPGNNIVYRIPAIATAHNGDVIAVADYRYGGADIGFGRVSLHARISKDNGATWGDKIVVAESHQGQYGVDKANDLEAGFGDPAIVADRESDNVLLLSCCGNVSYPAGTWAHHQGVARFRSSDNGATWSTYEDIAPSIYQQFKDAGVNVQALFIGSGRIFQSRFTKVGDYYRLYAVCLLRTATQGGLNYVLYSDDFGENWQILGDDATPGVTSGDEPKAEELPDGSVLLSSRVTGGRIFNIFQFTDVAQGEGSWMKQAWSDGNSTNGTVAQGNSCNGEIMIVPVVRNSDGKKMWLAMQSVPLGPGGRYNVGIYYKGLTSFADFASPTAFANNWEGRHQASYMSSAYSTMTLQHDGGIGFLYEEDTFGRSYTIVYKNYSIETITDEAYTLDTEAIDPFVLTTDGVEAKTSGLPFSAYVGGIKESEREAIEAAVAAFKANPCAETYVAINNTVAQAERNVLDPNVRYIIRNAGRGTAGSLAMSVASASTLKLGSSAYSATNEKLQWSLIPAEADGTWHLYNTSTKSWLMNTLAVETDMYTTTDEGQAGTYRIEGQNDHLCMICTAPTNASYPAIHLPANTARMVCWTAGGEASQWFFEATDVPVDNPTGVTAPDVDRTEVGGGCIYDLQGRVVTKPSRGVYITPRRKKVAVK